MRMNCDSVRVNYLVPTLNRGRYVLRAVERSLALGREGEVRVVVLDSMSDDGSYEALRDKFGENAHVSLRQNQRGRGIVQSWLDAVPEIDAQLATFMWSDDFPFETHRALWGPALRDGFAVGYGLVRDVDADQDPHGDSGASSRGIETERISPGEYFAGIVGKSPRKRFDVSPASALMASGAVRAWSESIRGDTTATWLRDELMWKRAIGPDLLLLLLGAQRAGAVVVVSSDVVQFSSHMESITVASDSWPLRTGYWLASVTALRDWQIASSLPRRKRVSLRLVLIARGVKLGATGSALGARSRRATQAAVLREVLTICRFRWKGFSS